MTAVPPDVAADLRLENARLQAELRAAGDRQNATAEILRTIASAPSDAERALNQIAETSARLFGAPSATIHIAEGDGWARTIRFGASSKRVGAGVPDSQLKIGGRNMPGTIVGENRQVNIPDVDNVDPAIADWPGLPHVRAAGTRSMSGSPLRREGNAIGALIVYRDRLAPFTDDEMALQQSFADQAAISIENARLFNEAQEALERQIATAEILKVIASSPSDVQPVFDVIVERAVRLCGARMGRVYRYDGNLIQMVGGHGLSVPARDSAQQPFPRAAADDTLVGRVMLSRRPNILADLNEDETVPPLSRQMIEALGARSQVTMPMLLLGEPIGAITLSWAEPRGYTDQQITLLQTFADQAVIAVENVRLFNETKEALERQTATAEILKVIASSPSDVQPVFEAIVNSAAKLFEPCSATITTLKDDKLHWDATAASISGFDVERTRTIYPIRFDPERVPSARAVLERRIIEIPDIAAPDTPEVTRNAAAFGGFRSITFVPLVDREQGIGTIIFTHPQAGFRFSERQLAIIQTFADQAVIAIQNARLFNETKEALERQTATAEILKVIASSPSDVQPVFEAIADSAKRLIGGFSTTVLRFIGEELHLVAYTPTDPAADEALKTSFPRLLAEFPSFALVRDGATVQFPDTESETVPRANRELGRLRGFRGVLFTPLMSQGTPIGMISVTRAEPGAFVAHHVQLLQTFADQAVIAIENVRLFNETQEALERQTATADILKVIASSPTDVQPVFEAIATSANRLLGGFSTAVFRFVDQTSHLAAFTPTNPAADNMLRTSFPRPVASFEQFTLAQSGQPIQVPDIETLPDSQIRQIARARGFRGMLFSPLMNKGTSIGLISVTRLEPGAFVPHHVQLLQTFADQAVIAIENVRLFNETKEALERQTATADILKVIASSPDNVQPVFDAIAASSKQLLGGFSATVFRFVDGVVNLAAYTPVNPAADKVLKASFPRPAADLPIFELAKRGEVVQEPDSETNPDAAMRELSRARGFRSSLFSPLMSKGTPIGLIVVTRKEPGSFADHHVQLLQTFADQAVIAIENARLFDEVQLRTRELRETLDYQTATSEVLSVISRSPTDAQPVFDAIAKSAALLCDAVLSNVQLFDGELLHIAATYNFNSDVLPQFIHMYPRRPDNKQITGRAILSGAVVHIPDLFEDPDYPRELALSGNWRAILAVPMIRDGRPVGAIAVSKGEPMPFSDRQVALLQTFAEQAIIAIGNVNLFKQVQARTEDLQESLQQQTATADVLKVISRSAFDLQSVLDTLTESAATLCNADMASISRQDGPGFYHVTNYNFAPDWVNFTKDFRMQSGRGSVVGRALLEGRVVQVADVLADPEYTYLEPQKKSGYRTFLGVPLLREGNPIGVLSLCRRTVAPFTEKQIELVSSFADQAVIAIENVRLFDEVQAKTRDLTEALTYQTGSSNILKVIASSPTDVEPVLKAIVDSACELCNAYDAIVRLRNGDHLELSAHHGPIPVAAGSLPISPNWTGGLAVIERRPVHIHDLLSSEGDPFPEAQQRAREYGHRTILTVPMLREGESVGVIIIRRNEVAPFSDKQIALLQTFADQAVIAIDNVRLFDEVQEKTRDLTEALQQQTATADVLKVISRSVFDLQAVLDTLVESAYKLCGADLGLLYLRGDQAFECKAIAGAGVAEVSQIFKGRPIRASRGTAAERVILTGEVQSVADFDEDLEFDPRVRDFLRKAGEAGSSAGRLRSTLAVPMTRDNAVVGVMVIARSQTGPFPARQIELLQTFADQAVIAIENARLFDEVQAKTRDLSEALTYQTESANILNVIASSPTDVGPALQVIVESACRLCDAYDAGVLLKVGDDLQFSAHHGPIPIGMDKWPLNRNWVNGRSVIDKVPVHVSDFHGPEGAEFPDGREQSRRMGHRCCLSVPLLREGESIGTIALRRLEPVPFSDKQIALLQTFADQAVIAISNVRLFDEVQAKTGELTEALEYQTAIGDVLNVISRSPNNLQPVMDTIVHTARRLCQSEYALMLRRENDGVYRIAAHSNASPELMEWMQNNPVVAGDGSAVGIVAAEQQTVHLPDALADPRFTDLRRQRHSKARTMLGVPLLLDQNVIGVVFLARTEVKPFSDKQVELVTSFADQAVIAISNVGLFNEVQERTRELSQSLDELRTAQDRLVQTEKLASLGQLTAGIAHEIKNPLNFVNNFAALSAELTDELNDVLKPVTLSDKIREEIDELTGLLKDNLEKVVQHGKRADSIVKNMLLHSREGSGEHRPADINALLDESLNLAYHGARAEKPEFNVTLQRDFDLAAGTIELFPQEITRVFLNLISNGFYAVTKRKTENGSKGFEPKLSATTKSLGDTVEIRIRDNGTGIPLEVKEKMFNPFFTTKPAGEGTGLGLSMSHDIIVKQHGGTIDVATEPGQFTEFTVVLPRTSHLQNKKRGQS